jgi:hypothetical protein
VLGATGATAAAVAAVLVARRSTHGWGATPEERRMRLPGDDLVPDPAIVSTRGVTIEAAAASVWPWLAQMGQDRGGMYSYDRLENLFGLDIHSADRIHDEWQDVHVGDRIVLVPPGWPVLRAGYSLPVAVVDPPHTLVLRQSPPEHPWDAVWSFHLRPLGPGACRLLSRGRARRRAGLPGVADLVLDTVMDPVTFAMTRRMLLGIKARAESTAG